MEIKYKTVYTVTPFNQPPIKFDRVEDAVACVDRALHNAFDHINQNAFDGSVSWATEEAPATPLDELLAEYGHNLHAPDGDEGVDRDSPFLLVEENVYGGYWLSSGTDPDELAANHFNQEYAEDWELIGIFDVATGERVHGTSEVSY